MNSRKTRHRFAAVFAWTLTCFIAASQSSAGDPAYAIFQIPTASPSLYEGGAAGINDDGVVVGFGHVLVSPPTGERGITWSNLQFTIPDPLPGMPSGGDTRCQGINENGDIVGFCTPSSGDPVFRGACHWQDGVPLALEPSTTLPSEALLINNAGLIVGISSLELGHQARFEACKWENGVVSALAQLAGGNEVSRPFDINDAGFIVGWASGPNNDAYAVVWHDDQVFELAPNAIAYGINNSNQIVGSIRRASGEVNHPFLWDNGSAIDLYNPRNFSGSQTFATDINDARAIVGVSDNRAWVQVGDEQVLLSELLAPRQAIKPNQLAKINNAGAIVGSASFVGGGRRPVGFVAYPIRATMELSPLAPGEAGSTNSISITNATPNAEVVLYFGVEGGGSRIAECDLADNALQINAARGVLQGTADENGSLTLQGFVPAAFAHRQVLLQAACSTDCTLSAVQLVTFP